MSSLVRSFALLGLFVLAACAAEPRVRANIESFSTLGEGPVSGTVVVVPAADKDAGSLEFQTYAERVDAALERRGFTPAVEGAAWRMTLDYGIGDGREVVDSYSVPAFGYGYRDYSWGTRARRGYYGAYSGYRTEVYSRTVYRRYLDLALADAATGVEVWQVKVVSDGRCPQLEPVFDALLAAAFDGFPAAQSRAVDVKFEAIC